MNGFDRLLVRLWDIGVRKWEGWNNVSACGRIGVSA
jgi:hypothetical protein